MPQELQHVELLKAVHEVSINKFNFLDMQLAYLNDTLNAQLHKLTKTVSHLAPEQLKVIDKALEDLSVAQKRINLSWPFAISGTLSQQNQKSYTNL